MYACVYIYIHMYVHLCLCAGGLPYACVGDDLLLVVPQLSQVSSLHEKNSSAYLSSSWYGLCVEIHVLQ